MLRRNPIQASATIAYRLLRLFRQSKGFTLIELIAAFLLIGLLASIIGMGLVAAMRSNEISRVHTQLAQKGQPAMARLARELMELTDIIAASDPDDGGDPYILYERMPAGSQEDTARFCIHLNRVNHILSLYSNLNKSVTRFSDLSIDQADTLLDGVSALNLSYRMGQAGDWPVDADLRLLSTIRITLDLSRQDPADESQHFSTIVHLRNTNNFGGASPAARPVSRNDYGCFINAAGGRF